MRSTGWVVVGLVLALAAWFLVGGSQDTQTLGDTEEPTDAHHHDPLDGTSAHSPAPAAPVLSGQPRNAERPSGFGAGTPEVPVLDVEGVGLRADVYVEDADGEGMGPVPVTLAWIAPRRLGVAPVVIATGMSDEGGQCDLRARPLPLVPAAWAGHATLEVWSGPVRGAQGSASWSLAALNELAKQAALDPSAALRIELEITITSPRGHLVRGRVQDAEGRPVPGALVGVEHEARGVYRVSNPVLSDPEGRFEASGVPEGEQLVARLEGLASPSARHRLAPPTAGTAVRVIMDDLHWLHVEVHASDGEAVRGAPFVLTNTGADLTTLRHRAMLSSRFPAPFDGRRAWSDAQGRVDFPGVAAEGTYDLWVEVTAPGDGPRERRLATGLRADDVRAVTTPASLVPLRLEVRDAGTQALLAPHASVRFRYGEHGRWTNAALAPWVGRPVSSDRGWASIWVTRGTPLSVQLSAPAYMAFDREIVAFRPDDLHVHLRRRDQGPTLRVRYELPRRPEQGDGPGGAPRDGALEQGLLSLPTIRAASHQTPLPTRWVRAQGTWQTNDLSPGHYVLQVEAPQAWPKGRLEGSFLLPVERAFELGTTGGALTVPIEQGGRVHVQAHWREARRDRLLVRWTLTDPDRQSSEPRLYRWNRRRGEARLISTNSRPDGITVNLRPGIYEIRAEADRAQPLTHRVEVLPGRIHPLEFVMVPAE